MKNLPIAVAGLLFLATFSFAGPSQLNNVRTARNFDKAPLKKVLVIGLAETDEKRQLFENSFVEIIRQRGGQAESGLAVIPAGQRLKKETIQAAMQGKGFDAVLVSRLISQERRNGYVPDSSFDGVLRSGYLQYSKVVSVQTNIFSPDGELIWSAESETFDPASIKDLVASMAKAIGADLSAKGLINTKTR